MTHRVVITGCGYVSALGIGKDVLFEALKNGKSGIRNVEGIFEGIVMKEAGPVMDLDPLDHFEPSMVKQQLDRFSQFAMIAAREAVAQSALDITDEVKRTTGVIIGSSAGGMISIEDNLVENKSNRVHPMLIPKSMASAPASQVSMDMGFHGPAFTTASACSSSAHAIAQAVMMIRSGLATRMVTGGTETTHLRSAYRAWDSLRVVTRDKCRPFSKDRNGIVLGEGAGMYVLEELEAAKRRNAPILCEVIGIGMSADATDIVAPQQEWVEASIQNCINDAKLNTDEIGYINAHGTGTKMNDVCESQAIRKVFKGNIENLWVSSTKPIHGHTLGAAAGLELASLLLAFQEDCLAPTLNYNESDPECDLNYVTHNAREQKTDVALCNSFAFGGLNAVLALRKFH